MRKRLEKLEQSIPDNSLSRLQKLFNRWKEGQSIDTELKKVFEMHPEWRHRPPGEIGKSLYCNWKEFAGHSLVIRVKHGIIGECECGYYPPKNT